MKKKILILLIALSMAIAITSCGGSDDYTEVDYMRISFQVSDKFIVDEDISEHGLVIMLADGSPGSSILVNWTGDIFFGDDQEAFLSSFMLSRIGLLPEENREWLEMPGEPLGGNRFRKLEYWKYVGGTRMNHQSYFLFRDGDGVYEFTLMQIEGGDTDITNDFLNLLRSVD